MAAIVYFKIIILHYIYSSTVSITINKERFQKFNGENVRVNSNVEATSAVSLLNCCAQCVAMAGCCLLNYNSLSLHDNCELISSGQSDISLLTSQPGWKIFFENAGSASCTSNSIHDTLSWSVVQVFQRRQDGSVDFYRGWDDYVKGFGTPSGEYWLGLDLIHQITSSGNYELRVDLEDFEGGHFYAKYGSFYLDGADRNYALHVDSYTGDAGDSLGPQNNMPFSTYDRDNDQYSGGNCAQTYHGAWWYNSCHYSNLNGRYSPVGDVTDYAQHVTWYRLLGHYYSFKTTEMKMRKISEPN